MFLRPRHMWLAFNAHPPTIDNLMPAYLSGIRLLPAQAMLISEADLNRVKNRAFSLSQVRHVGFRQALGSSHIASCVRKCFSWLDGKGSEPSTKLTRGTEVPAIARYISPPRLLIHALNHFFFNPFDQIVERLKN